MHGYYIFFVINDFNLEMINADLSNSYQDNFTTLFDYDWKCYVLIR